MSDNVSDAKIAGDGTIGAGTYGTVTINGAGTVTGDIECRELKINGAGKCRGAVKADSVAVNGAGTFDGPVQAGSVQVNGSADVHAGMGVGRLLIRGTCGLDGGLAAHEIDIRGELRVGGDLTAEQFVGEGRFVVNGLLNADIVDLKLHGRSSAREIGGERITLRIPEGFSSLFSMFSERRLVADVIEADDVYLIDTTAKVVRGARIVLGEGCDIDLVEYTERLDRVPGAQVREERKVES